MNLSPISTGRALGQPLTACFAAQWMAAPAGLDIEQRQRCLRALSVPLRLKLLVLLADGERCVAELVRASGSSQPNVSGHLKLLRQAGLVERRRCGTTVCYRQSDSAEARWARGLWQGLLGAVLPQPAATRPG